MIIIINQSPKSKPIHLSPTEQSACGLFPTRDYNLRSCGSRCMGNHPTAKIEGVRTYAPLSAS